MATSSSSLSVNLERPRRTTELKPHCTRFHLMQHLMRRIYIRLNFCAFNASLGASATVFVLLGGEKGILFFSLVHVVSSAVPEKETFCLIRREKIAPFFSLAAAFLTDTSRFDDRVHSGPRDLCRSDRIQRPISRHVTCKR